LFNLSLSKVLTQANDFSEYKNSNWAFLMVLIEPYLTLHTRPSGCPKVLTKSTSILFLMANKMASLVIRAALEILIDFTDLGGILCFPSEVSITNKSFSLCKVEPYELITNSITMFLG